MIFNLVEHKSIQNKVMCYKSLPSYHMQKHNDCHQTTEILESKNKTDFAFTPFLRAPREIRILFIKQVLALPIMTQWIDCVIASLTLKSDKLCFLLLKDVFIPNQYNTCLPWVLPSECRLLTFFFKTVDSVKGNELII